MTEDPEILGTSGSSENRGLASVTVPYFAATLADALVVGRNSPLANLEYVTRSFRAGPSGHYEVEVTYEGPDTNGDGGDSDSAREAVAVYSATGSFREEPIEAHPQIRALLAKYNGQEDPSTGKITFPAMLTGTTGTNALEGENGTPKETKNPMAGVEKFMALEVVWSKSYIQRAIPRNLFTKVGRVIRKPPGPSPIIPKRNSWLINPPRLTKRGKVWDIEESWTLLPEGTPSDVYNL